MIVLTSNDYIPYEGTRTTIVGVFSSQEVAEEAAMEWALRTHAHCEDKERVTPTPLNGWTYWDNGYDSTYFDFEEVELDKFNN